MKNFTTVLKIAPAFLLAGSLMQAQTGDTISKEKAIEEVVLVGYGKQRKTDLTGSITAVSEREFNKGAIVSADQLIQGKAPGVRITNNGGSPDSNPNIRIRGGSSLSAQNNPLIVIDGVPLDTQNPAGSGNPLNLINPNDIESFSILKDASATAIYGNRGSNGVIIIKTKRGGGRLKVNFNTNVSVGTVSNYIDVMNAEQFTSFINTNYPQYNYLLGVGGSETNKTVPGTIYDTDWQKEIYRKSVSTDNNLSISGSLFNKLPTRFSVGYNRTEGLVKTNDYERYSTALNISPSFFDNHLKIDFSLKGLFSELNAIDEGGAIGGALNMNPTLPVYVSQTGLSGEPYNRFGGYYQNVVLKGNQYLIQGQANPLAILMQRQAPQEIAKFLGNAEINYKFHFMPDLRAVVNLGLEASQSDLETIYGENAIATYRNPQNGFVPNDFAFSPGTDYAERQNIVNQTMDAYLVYEKRYSGILSNLLVQGGYTYQNFKNDGFKTNYRYDDATGLRILNPGTALNPNNRYYNVLNLQSFLGRANVDFLDKYLFTLNFRADASSLFQKNKRWGYFPGVGFAWKVNKDFFTDSQLLNELKMRVGWGRTGNADIISIAGFYPSSAYFSIGGTSSQYFPGVGTYSALPFNPNLTWETTETINAGLDFSFLKDRISGSVDVYDRKTENLLAKVSIPPGQSLTNEFTTNVGSLRNKGIEANLTVVPVRTETVNWSVSGNFAYNDSEILELGSVINSQDLNSTLPVGNGVKLATNLVGAQPYAAWVYEQVYDANGNPLDNVYVDRNSDGIINEDDRYTKAIRPRWTYGFSTIVSYKNWDFNAAFRGQIGGLIYNTRKIAQGLKSYTVPSNSLSLNNTLTSTVDSPFTISDNLFLSDYFLEDSSFLRLDNVTVGYLMKNVFKNVNVRVYASVNNAFILTNYSGQDPENFSGIDNNFYPRPRTYTLGFNFNF